MSRALLPEILFCSKSFSNTSHYFLVYKMILINLGIIAVEPVIFYKIVTMFLLRLKSKSVAGEVPFYFV